MLCNKCMKNEATIHFTQVSDGKTKKILLCEKCAEESGFDLKKALTISGALAHMDAVNGTDNDHSEEKQEQQKNEMICPFCNMRLSQYKKKGQLGCPTCYQAFADALEPMIKKLHRAERHRGKSPLVHTPRDISEPLNRLDKLLKEAIKAERYEEAAQLHDRITRLKQGAP
ncbi:MAG: hypothetical protein EOL87_16700 [Spartobacteria bacterium]|nr:hypothetical protein [Spartobacteria bacterium]